MLRRMNLGDVLKWLTVSWETTAELRMAAYELEDEPRPVQQHQALTAGMRSRQRPPGAPDLHTQLEDLFGEVWRQESFERRHPFTCGVIREAATSALNRRRG